MKDSITDLSDSRTEVDSGVVRSSSTGNFGFAFNDSNFSDRVLRIEIMACSYDSKSDSEGLSSLAAWDRNRKRRREDLKKESGPDAVVCPEEQVLTQADTEDVLGCENDDDEVLAMIEESPQGDNAARRNESSFSVDCSTVGLILTGDNATRSNSNESSFSMECSTVARTKTLHISSPILAEKSPFFYKLFSNGMKESEQRQVTLRINESEEAAFMELLDFMYSNTLRSSTAPALLDVLTVADKFEVISCMRECSRLLRDLPMTPDSALLYLDLPSTILTGEAVQPLTDAAKQYLAERYKDISRFQDEVMDLPITGIEAIFGSDSLQAASEDGVYDFILKWARSKYPKLEDRRPILATRLACLIRFPFMSCRKLRKVLTCADFDHGDASKLVLEALFYKSEPPHRQRSFAASATSAITRRRFMERAYKYRPIKVVEFELPRPQCIVYLDLKKEECTNLWHTGGRVYSQAFHLGGQGFFLSVHCNMDQHSAFHCFGLFLGMQEKGAVSFTVDYEFSARMKPSEEFQSKYKGNYTFTGGKAVGYRNLFGMPWTSFMADDSAYFINGVLHLRAELTMGQARN